MQKVSARQLPSHPVSHGSHQPRDPASTINSLLDSFPEMQKGDVARLLLSMHHFGKDNSNGLNEPRGSDKNLASETFRTLNQTRTDFIKSRGGNPAQQSISSRKFDEAARDCLSGFLPPAELNEYQKTKVECSELFRKGEITEQEIGYRLSDTIELSHIKEKNKPSTTAATPLDEGPFLDILKPGTYVIVPSEPLPQKDKNATRLPLGATVSAVFEGFQRNDRTTLAFSAYLWGASVKVNNVLVERFEKSKANYISQAGNDVERQNALAREFNKEARNYAALCLFPENGKKYQAILKAANATYESSPGTREDFAALKKTMCEGTLKLLQQITTGHANPSPSDDLQKIVGNALLDFKPNARDPLTILSYSWRGKPTAEDKPRFGPFETAKRNYMESEPDQKNSRDRAREFTEKARDHALRLLPSGMKKKYEQLLKTSTDRFNATQKSATDYEAHALEMRTGIAQMMRAVTGGHHYGSTASSNVAPPLTPSSQ